jgi:hypothetical protein
MKHQPRNGRSGARREHAEALLAKYEISEQDLLSEMRSGRLKDPELLDAAAHLEDEVMDTGENNTGVETSEPDTD